MDRGGAGPPPSGFSVATFDRSTCDKHCCESGIDGIKHGTGSKMPFDLQKFWLKCTRYAVQLMATAEQTRFPAVSQSIVIILETFPYNSRKYRDKHEPWSLHIGDSSGALSARDVGRAWRTICFGFREGSNLAIVFRAEDHFYSAQ
jgi:hypothetical protein